MFMGKSNNNGGVNVNSNLYVSYSDTCMLKVGAWNLNLSIKFHPFKGVNADGIRQYAQDNTEVITTSLTIDNTSALLEGIKDVIEPAISEKKEASVSIAMGASENRKALTLKTDGNDIFLSIAVGLDENGVTAESNVLTHKFNKKEYMVGYDPTTGSGETVQSNADYDNFVEKLKDIYKLTAATAHSINYSNALKTSYSNRHAANSYAPAAPTQPANNINLGDLEEFLPMN